MDDYLVKLKPKEENLSFKRYNIICLNKGEHGKQFQEKQSQSSKATDQKVLDISQGDAIPKWSHC